MILETQEFKLILLTCFLNCWHSSGVSVSALAISGMIFTFSCKRFINSISNGLSLKYTIFNMTGLISLGEEILHIPTLNYIHWNYFTYSSETLPEGVLAQQQLGRTGFQEALEWLRRLWLLSFNTLVIGFGP